MKIFSDDGVLFTSEEECLAYEERQRRHAAQKASRQKEVQEAHEAYLALLEQYNKDYAGEKANERDALWQKLISLYD